MIEYYRFPAASSAVSRAGSGPSARRPCPLTDSSAWFDHRRSNLTTVGLFVLVKIIWSNVLVTHPHPCEHFDLTSM